MKLSQLRHLVEAVESGTIREASRRLFLSQSSVTKSIRQLELELGVELLHRDAHGVTPTAAGRALVQRAKRIEAEIRYALNEIDEIQGAHTGDLQLVVSPSVALTLLPRVISGFTRSRPRVTFHVDEGVYPDILRSVRAGDADFAICLLPEPLRDDYLEYELLFKDAVTPAVRRGHPLAGKHTTMQVLARETWVAYLSGRTSQAVFEKTFSLAGKDLPEKIIECTSFASCLALVEQGDYVTLVPRQLLAEPETSGNLVAVEIDSRLPNWSVAVIYRRQTELSPVAHAFLDALRDGGRQLVQESKRPAARKTRRKKP